jgi:hypothetical protein
VSRLPSKRHVCVEGNSYLYYRRGRSGAFTVLSTAAAEFLDEIQTKVLRVFLIAILSHLYSFSLRFILLQAHATSYDLLYTAKENGGKPDRKPYHLPYG